MRVAACCPETRRSSTQFDQTSGTTSRPPSSTWARGSDGANVRIMVWDLQRAPAVETSKHRGENMRDTPTNQSLGPLEALCAEDFCFSFFLYGGCSLLQQTQGVSTFNVFLHAFSKSFARPAAGASRARSDLEGENGAGVLAAKLARGIRHAAFLRTPSPAWGTNRCSIG